MKEGSQLFRTEELKSAMQQAIRDHLNPLFHIEDVVLVSSLPRTASNKVMRRVLRNQYAEEPNLKGTR
jgi:acetyl-CoA synthetase